MPADISASLATGTPKVTTVRPPDPPSTAARINGTTVGQNYPAPSANVLAAMAAREANQYRQ